MRPSTTSVRSKLQVGVRTLRLLSLSILARTCDHVRLTGSTLFVRAETSLLQLLSAKGDGVVSVLDDPLRYMRYDQDPLRGAEGAVVRAHGDDGDDHVPRVDDVPLPECQRNSSLSS